MGRGDRLLLALLAVLGLACARSAVALARHAERGARFRVELGRNPVARLAPATVARLEGLEGAVHATYYVSGREHMPSSMRRVERQVTDLLTALHAAAPERFDFEIVDPEESPEAAALAARRRVAPFRLRSVSRDAWSERTVWSTLTLASGARPEAVLNGIGPETVPRLQAAIVAQLDQIERPRVPRLAFAAPPGFDELRGLAAERASVLDVDLDGGAPLPEDADLVLWLAPGAVTPSRLGELDRALERGTSVVIAGSEVAIDPEALRSETGPALRLRPDAPALRTLLAHFGLAPVRALLLDERSDEIRLGGETFPAPFVLRCIAPNQDFRGWRGQPNGTLSFAVPTALALDADELARRALRARVLATSSDATRAVLPRPEGPVPLAALAGSGEPVAKQALAVALAREDPWAGRAVFLSATTPFEDGLLFSSTSAHAALARTLFDELLADERLLAVSSWVAEAPPVPELSSAERTLLRGACVFLLPLVLAVLALRRGALSTSGPLFPHGLARAGARAAVVAAVVLLVVRVAGALEGRADLTSDGVNGLAPETRALARRVAAGGALDAELLLSAPAALPPRLRQPARRLAATLFELERAGLTISVARTDPDDLDSPAREALARRGVTPFRATTRDEEVETVRTFWATLLLRRDGREERVDFPDAAAFERTEFRLAFALWRVDGGEAPVVAFASDVPRLSAAEAHEDYQTQGLFAPQGSDVYGVARRLLAREGYRIAHVNPRAPELPDGADLLVWLQPRRSIEPLLEQTARYLHGGGRVLLAAQHFNVQSRQYRGAGFDVVHWPQPQSPDLEALYLPELGIELVREVLFDERMTPTTTDAQITGRRAGRDVERHAEALPFNVRTAAETYAPSPITRNVGDLAFLQASPIRWDAARLRALGIEATPLIETSAHAWTFAWRGGWLPRERLAGPARDPHGAPLWEGPLALAVLFEGSFPRPSGPLRLRPDAEDEGADAGPADRRGAAEEPWPDAAPGALFFVGCSELFKDAHLLDETFRADRLLTNAVAALALPPELAAIAAHRATPRGFSQVTPGERLAWRAAVVSGGPLLVLAAGALASLAAARRRRATLAALSRAEATP